MSFTAEDQFRIGVQLLEENSVVEALHHLRLAESDMPPGYDLHVALGRALREDGKHGEAAGYFRRAVSEDGDRPEAYMEWSELCRRQGKKAEARKLEVFGVARGGRARSSQGPENTNWNPDATAPVEGDLAFHCPNCTTPILHGQEGWACPSCRMNLQPLLRGHILVNRLLDGSEEFRCAQCRTRISGKEIECPHCESDLMTGDLPEEEDRPGRARKARSPFGTAVLALGFLLLCFGVGQLSVPSKRVEAGKVWGAVVQRVTHGASEGVDLVKGPKVNGPNANNQLNDTEIMTGFTEYFGFILVGGVVIALAGLKIYFDRLN
jgi:rubrerythrin